jgi:hypothetical protein
MAGAHRASFYVPSSLGCSGGDSKRLTPAEAGARIV